MSVHRQRSIRHVANVRADSFEARAAVANRADAPDGPPPLPTADLPLYGLLRWHGKKAVAGLYQGRVDWRYADLLMLCQVGAAVDDLNDLTADYRAARQDLAAARASTDTAAIRAALTEVKVARAAIAATRGTITNTIRLLGLTAASLAGASVKPHDGDTEPRKSRRSAPTPKAEPDWEALASDLEGDADGL
jgi:hypothetical protein